MLGLLFVAALAGLALLIASPTRAARRLGAGLLILPMIALGWIIALLRADGPPDPLPHVQQITTPAILP